MNPTINEGGGRPAPAILRWIVEALAVSGRLVCVVTLVVLFVGLLANVILRYAVGAGLDWAYDIHAILLPWMIAGGLVLGTIYNRNIAITILPDMMSAETRQRLFLLVSLLTLVISVTVVWSSLPILRASQYQRITALGGISQFWGYASIVYGFGAVAIICICDLLAGMTGRPLRGTNVASSLS